MVSSKITPVFSLVAFAAIHSLTASLPFKRLIVRGLGSRVDRLYLPVYSLIAVLTILPLVYQLYKNPGRVLYKIPSPWRWLMAVGLSPVPLRFSAASRCSISRQRGPDSVDEMRVLAKILVWLQTSEPISLWCGDETEGETIHACMMINEPLLRYQYGTSRTEPALAERYEANPELTQYTFHLRPNVRWSDGTGFSAADVFATYAAQWDSKNPNHKGNSGVFEYFGGFFGSFLK